MTEEIKVPDATAADKAKAVVAVLLVLGGITGYYSAFGAARLGALARRACRAGIGCSCWWRCPLMAAACRQFVLDARVELRKIVWPTRQETGQVTLAVFIFVIVAGLFFWLVDLGLAWATRFLSGQGGA